MRNQSENKTRYRFLQNLFSILQATKKQKQKGKKR